MNDRTERLKVILRINAKSRGAAKIGDRVFSEIAPSGGISNSQILHALIKSMAHLGMALDFRCADGEVVTAERLLKRFEKGGEWGAGFEANGLLFCVGRIPVMHQCFVSIEEKVPGSAHSWDVWVEPFLVEVDFVQAWVSDVEYDYWQNASDPIEYISAGRDYSDLPLKSNGLPFPLEQKVVDISNNPGRWAMKAGYMEAVGATMWLGDNFWQAIGNDGQKNNLAAIEGIHAQPVEHGVVRYTVADGCFKDLSTMSQQNNIRSILYGSLQG